MDKVQAAVGFDRLPWLADEPQPPAPRSRRRGWGLWLALALAAMVVIAGAAYWVGTRSAEVRDAPAMATPYRPPVTIPLPAPLELPPATPPTTPAAPIVQPQAQPQIAIEQPPVVNPAPVPRAPVAAQRPAKARKAKAAPARARSKPTRPARAAATTRKSQPLAIWPVRAERNSAGRLVRVGTFATTRDAKRGWSKVMRFYPGMKRLPALVVPVRAVPSGRKYYRLQMGTTSQAHSEVLCQRMRIIGTSCVVLDIQKTVRPAK